MSEPQAGETSRWFRIGEGIERPRTPYVRSEGLVLIKEAW